MLIFTRQEGADVGALHLATDGVVGKVYLDAAGGPTIATTTHTIWMTDAAMAMLIFRATEPDNANETVGWLSLL